MKFYEIYFLILWVYHPESGFLPILPRDTGSPSLAFREDDRLKLQHFYRLQILLLTAIVVSLLAQSPLPWDINAPHNCTCLLYKYVCITKLFKTPISNCPFTFDAEVNFFLALRASCSSTIHLFIYKAVWHIYSVVFSIYDNAELTGLAGSESGDILMERMHRMDPFQVRKYNQNFPGQGAQPNLSRSGSKTKLPRSGSTTDLSR